jgi:uncharacterized protein YcfL
MARQQQNTVDYFPFLCKEGEAMFYIENKYGNDGYATWIKILRQLAVTNYHYLNLSEYKTIMFLSSKCKVDEKLLLEIITDLCNIGEFNKQLWEQNKIIYSEKFIENIKDAYSRRKNECINLHTLCIHLNTLGVQSAYILNQNVYTKPQSVDINTHSIVEYSIVKDIKVKDNKENDINISFDVFWNLYNKKVGDKKKLEKKWNKLKNDERQKIIDTLPNFLNSIKDKQYLPYPETYLNNSRWNDEILINTSIDKKHYYLSSPFGNWDGLLTEEEFKAKTLTNHWTLIKTI